MSHLSTTLRIGAPAHLLFDVIADPARSLEWQTLLVDMAEVSGRPGGVGSSYTGFCRVVGRRLAVRFVVTAAERPGLFQVSATTTGGWARWTTVIVPAAEAACEVRVDLEYELPGQVLGSLVGLFAESRIERELRRTYENLRRLAESDVTERGVAPGGQLATS